MNDQAIQRKALNPIKNRINQKLKDLDQYINYGASLTKNPLSGDLDLKVRRRKPNGSYVGLSIITIGLVSGDGKDNADYMIHMGDAPMPGVLKKVKWLALISNKS